MIYWKSVFSPNWKLIGAILCQWNNLNGFPIGVCVNRKWSLHCWLLHAQFVGGMRFKSKTTQIGFFPHPDNNFRTLFWLLLIFTPLPTMALRRCFVMLFCALSDSQTGAVYKWAAMTLFAAFALPTNAKLREIGNITFFMENKF